MLWYERTQAYGTHIHTMKERKGERGGEVKGGEEGGRD